MARSNNILFIIILLIVGVSCTSTTHQKSPVCAIIPQPVSVQQQEGCLVLKAIKAPMDTNSLESLGVKRLVNPKLDMDEAGYLLQITKKGISIEGKTEQGIFYGVQSLIQLMSENQEGDHYILPLVLIKDYPRFQYRGMHLDVSRNFRSVEDVKRYLDLLALYKMNRFHWHLTDGTGWRIQIKKYPLLTRKAAFRMQNTWKDYWKSDRKLVDEKTVGAFGGYYTQEQIKDVVAYAAKKFITIIPEIEMPAHSEEVFVAYPNLCCSQKPYGNSDFCAGNDSTFVFLEEVLTEVMDLFPSTYIHVGGDEAGKVAWKTCPRCQKRMKTEKLHNVDELQSYFMKRIETFVESKGRKIIGWDEILDGGLPPRATVMSWRGEAGGIAAARQGHEVIMTPGRYCYLDAYQSNPSTEPEAIGGYLPLRKVYSYEPIPKALESQYQKKILGIQGCLWTEYIPTASHLQYMLMPRMAALAEVAWSPDSLKNWESFKARLQQHTSLLTRMGVHFHPASYELEATMKVDQSKQEMVLKFQSEQVDPEIRYTTDGSAPTAQSMRYQDSLVLQGSHVLTAAIFKNGQAQAPAYTKPLIYHKAIGKKVTYVQRWGDSYPAGGDSALVDGYRGTLGYGDGLWQGFTNDLDVTIDLGDTTTLHHFSATFMQVTGPGVYMPDYVKVYTSPDGRVFKQVLDLNNDVPKEKSELSFKDFHGEVNIPGVRYVRVFAKNPSGYIFTDELIIL